MKRISQEKPSPTKKLYIKYLKAIQKIQKQYEKERSIMQRKFHKELKKVR